MSNNGVLTLKRKGRKQYKSYMKKIRHGLFKYRFVIIVYYGQYCTSVFIDKKEECIHMIVYRID